MNIEVLTGAEMRKIPQPDGVEWPEDSLHVVTFGDDGQLLARIGLIAIPHVEGTWVDPSLRGTTTAARMLRRMEDEVRKLGRTHLFAFAHDTQPEVAAYLERFGYTRFPASVWVKELQKCQ
jgi:N-acetylglutamate synthase-like GNAT family acetyltransferase